MELWFEVQACEICHFTWEKKRRTKTHFLDAKKSVLLFRHWCHQYKHPYRTQSVKHLRGTQCPRPLTSDTSSDHRNDGQGSTFCQAFGIVTLFVPASKNMRWHSNITSACDFFSCDRICRWQIVPGLSVCEEMVDIWSHTESGWSLTRETWSCSVTAWRPTLTSKVTRIITCASALLSRRILLFMCSGWRRAWSHGAASVTTVLQIMDVAAKKL